MGVIRGSFSPYTGRDVFPLPVVFAFSVFLLVLRLRSSVSFLSSFLSFTFLIFSVFGGYKGVNPIIVLFCYNIVKIFISSIVEGRGRGRAYLQRE